MKLIVSIAFFGLSFLFSCSENKSKKNQIASENYRRPTSRLECSNSYYDSMLVVIGNNFEPKSIELDSSLSTNASLFLQNIDTNCLRQQAHYEKFIALVLAKLYVYHLSCCNQGYDLLSMNEGAASVIINEFKSLAGYNKKPHLEFLNSGKIEDYVESKQNLQKDPELKSLLTKIEREDRRIIEKGVF